MTLPILPELEPLLTPLLRQRSTLRLTAAARPADTQTISHYGGDPYFEVGQEWPRNPLTGEPLELIFQLVSHGDLSWPFPARIVQFYQNYHTGELPFEEGHMPEDFCIRFYPAIDAHRQISVSRPADLPAIAFHAIDTVAEPSLPTWEELEDISPATYAQIQQLHPANGRETYQAAVEELIGEPDFGSWVGGYAMWLQNASPTGTFWLQFDSTDDFSWGDAGLLYFFADLSNLANPEGISFQLQCC